MDRYMLGKQEVLIYASQRDPWIALLALRYIYRGLLLLNNTDNDRPRNCSHPCGQIVDGLFRIEHRLSRCSARTKNLQKYGRLAQAGHSGPHRQPITCPVSSRVVL